MDSEPHHAHGKVPPQERLNVFALVIYIPPPLGVFLDDLRRELVPHYNPHAHISVLPPRPLAVAWQAASAQVRSFADTWPGFDVELTGIEMFPVTNVIYIGVGAGSAELRHMHRSTNAGLLAFEEPFVYHPHVTLAQEIPHNQAVMIHEKAARLWNEFTGARTFRAEHAVLVQNTLSDCWLDLEEYSFSKPRHEIHLTDR